MTMGGAKTIRNFFLTASILIMFIALTDEASRLIGQYDKAFLLSNIVPIIIMLVAYLKNMTRTVRLIIGPLIIIVSIDMIILQRILSLPMITNALSLSIMFL